MSEQRECAWIKDDTLTSIVGYHMDCVKPEGATRIVSGNINGFQFCPFCGGRLRLQVLRVKRCPEIASRFVAIGDRVSIVERVSHHPELVKVRIVRSGIELLWHPNDLEKVDAMEGI
jgi:hypothetical protein